MTDTNRTLGLYIHIPFCKRKCGYCDFLSFPAGEEVMEAYVRALKNEIAAKGRDGRRTVDTVYFGGGTPSLLPVRMLADLLKTVAEAFSVTEDAEVTLECNPGTLEGKDTRVLFSGEAGLAVNRCSLGAQSFDDAELELLGRIHRSEDTVRAVSALREAGAQNLSLDLISALPGQDREAAQRSVRSALALAPEHLSLYSLILEEGTPFYERYAGQPGLLPPEETERAMYHDAQDLLASRGYRQYELSNFSLPGRESRHNLRYWKREDYLGFGLGAASMTGNVRWKNTGSLKVYLSCGGNAPLEDRHELTVKEQMEEFMFLGLRMSSGVSAAEFLKEFGVLPETEYKDAIGKHLANGLLRFENGRYFLSRRGMDLANYVMSDFLH